LTGRVTIGERVISGAAVTLTARATQLTRTVTTNARGTYWIGALTPGEYDVTFSRAGATSVTRPVTIELGRVARADAQLEPSEDEESVTSTAITVSVANTTAVTTHWLADELERIPVRRDVVSAEALAPVLPGNETIVNDSLLSNAFLLGEEALDEVTIIRGAKSVELDGRGSSVILARTRSGTDDLFFSLRDTYSTNGDGGNVIEAASGGRIVPQRLWFFAAGWDGDATDVGLHELRGLALNVDAQAGTSHHFTASHIDADARIAALTIDARQTSLRYVGVPRERWTTEALIGRKQSGEDVLAAKLSYRLADHVISVGGNDERDAFYLGDRWASGRWTVDAGARREDDAMLSRVALAFDLRSRQGSHALVANWGEYLDAQRDGRKLRVTGIGYTSSLESQGTARIDLFRYGGARAMDQIQADARYRLFDRFEAGGSYVYSRTDDLEVPEHLVSARVGVQVPFAGHELAAMVLERYDSTRWTTDIGVRYAVPYRRVAFTIAADATNVTEDAELRLWARIRR
jgi:hypothetical protein